MAEDRFNKTEPATPKRIADARTRGQVMKSREVTTSFVFMIILIYLVYNIKHIGGVIISEMVYFLSHASVIDFNQVTAMDIISKFIHVVMLIVLPFVLVVFFASIIANLAQVGFLFTLEPLIPDITRIDIMSGFKRFFSFQSANEFFKSVIKFFAISVVVYFTCIEYLHKIFLLQLYGVSYDMIFVLKVLYSLFFNILLVIIVLSIVDFMLQRYQYNKGLMMTKQEVKDETKQFEGDRQIKNKIRKMQREMARRKIIKEVKTAQVVITNPTHYAVALKYDKNKHDAPVLIAKGEDALALLIKKIALDNGIPTVENKYAARTIYELCEPGQLIPEKLYKVVAEILAHLYATNKKFKEMWGVR